MHDLETRGTFLLDDYMETPVMSRIDLVRHIVDSMDSCWKRH